MAKEMMWVGSYYWLLNIFIHIAKDLKTYKIGGLEAMKELEGLKVLGVPTKICSVSDISAVLNPR